jgi:hypothetical protein
MIGQGAGSMRRRLGSPKKYRDFAAQCFRWAARARSDEHKDMMLQMASHWLQTAEEMEHLGTVGSRSAAGLSLHNELRQRRKPSKNDERPSERH